MRESMCVRSRDRPSFPDILTIGSLKDLLRLPEIPLKALLVIFGIGIIEVIFKIEAELEVTERMVTELVIQVTETIDRFDLVRDRITAE
jgi:hypothetical protein